MQILKDRTIWVSLINDELPLYRLVHTGKQNEQDTYMLVVKDKERYQAEKDSLNKILNQETKKDVPKFDKKNEATSNENLITESKIEQLSFDGIINEPKGEQQCKSHIQ